MPHNVQLWIDRQTPLQTDIYIDRDLAKEPIALAQLLATALIVNGEGPAGTASAA